jgi:hypothetical protein
LSGDEAEEVGMGLAFTVAVGMALTAIVSWTVAERWKL